MNHLTFTGTYIPVSTLIARAERMRELGIEPIYFNCEGTEESEFHNRLRRSNPQSKDQTKRHSPREGQ